MSSADLGRQRAGPPRSCGPRSPLVTVALGQARLSTLAGSRSPISAASESVLRSQATSSGVPPGSGGPPTRTARESPITAPSYPVTGGPTGSGVRW